MSEFDESKISQSAPSGVTRNERGEIVAVPVAWRYWKDKWMDWNYETRREDIQDKYQPEPLFLGPAVQPKANPDEAPAEPSVSDEAITPASLSAAIGCKASTILSALQPADVTLNQPLTAEQVAALLAAMAEGAR